MWCFLPLCFYHFPYSFFLLIIVFIALLLHLLRLSSDSPTYTRRPFPIENVLTNIVKKLWIQDILVRLVALSWKNYTLPFDQSMATNEVLPSKKHDENILHSTINSCDRKGDVSYFLFTLIHTDIDWINEFNLKSVLLKGDKYMYPESYVFLSLLRFLQYSFLIIRDGGGYRPSWLIAHISHSLRLHFFPF